MANIFGKRLEMLMDEQKMSQVQLADALEIKKQSINSYIKGKSRPELDVLMRFADFFDCSVDFLLGRDDFRSYNQFKNYDAMIEKNFSDSLNILGFDKRDYYLDVITRHTNMYRATEGKAYNMEHFELTISLIEQIGELTMLIVKADKSVSENETVRYAVSSEEIISIDSRSAEHVLILERLLNKKIEELHNSIKSLGDIGFNILEKSFPQAYDILNRSHNNAKRVTEEFCHNFFGTIENLSKED